MLLPKGVVQDLFNCLRVAVTRAVPSNLLSPWPGVKDCPCLCETDKSTMRFWDEGGHSEVVVGTGFLGALGEHGTQEGCSPPSSHSRAEVPPDSSLLHTG